MSVVQYVVFTLGNEEYGIEISCAQEIIRIPQQISKVPNMPKYIEGIVNLRDKIVTVIDLKKRFGFDQAERGVDSRLLILKLENEFLGAIVDDVSEVLQIDDLSIEKLSSEIFGLGNNGTTGISRINDRLIMLIDAMQLKTKIITKDYKEVL